MREGWRAKDEKEGKMRKINLAKQSQSTSRGKSFEIHSCTRLDTKTDTCTCIMYNTEHVTLSHDSTHCYSNQHGVTDSHLSAYSKHSVHSFQLHLVQ